MKPLRRTAEAFIVQTNSLRTIARCRVKDGVVLVGSDPHIWPGQLTTVQRAFLVFAKRFSPKAVILNGDVFDGARISKYPSIGWEGKPIVSEEMAAVSAYLSKVTAASPKSWHAWPLGNHDMRFETRLAALVPEYEGVKGMHLKDHFPDWHPCWLVEINNDVVIKHRFANGIHAAYNNTLRSGKTICTGHLHSLKVTPWTDYNGTRYGVDCGTLAEPSSAQFVMYTEENPVNWRSGFIVLTFAKGKLLYPEIVQKWDDDHVQFRGEIIRV